ncbi:MMPL family transporter [Streptomyces somaliensis DSM 40738]|uniref:MMPL family transporter n=1 Tax=Streptomyces somaliensis (strain ATCC 33201 / DSM 40738 / JCM 12659 / KCTC 9044 / NCTC 11332 / NRRL B-12077 / IP 733) TaxID=1134445 RepID=A0AA44DBU6_STRE0|nr:MMPL family transporter [Streptomyces somaliensis]MCQ0023876.1 MMPL family transporter [Streptomyces somaliensis DSM 40738]NKY13361.1 MMPL family transporter [Streptomyces somaliensis DSM 40738]
MTEQTTRTAAPPSGGGPRSGPDDRGYAARLAQGTARLTRRRRRPLATLWIVLLLVAGYGATQLADALSGGGWYVTGSDSAAAAQRVTRGFEGRGATSLTLVVRDTRHDRADPAFDERVRDVVDRVTRDPGLKVTGSYGYTTLTDDRARAAFTGKDGNTALVRLGSGLDDGTARRVLPDIQEGLSDAYERQGLRVSLVSQAALWGEVNHLSERGLVRAELITLPLIALVLLLLFRSVAAALASLLVGITSVAFTLGLLAVLARHTEISVFVQNAATMLGLGVGVDYSLFVIMRFKDELRAEGPDPSADAVERAVARTLRTSGETVVASGVTIVAAMSTLFLVDLNVIWSMALGAVVVVAFSILTSVLLLPVLLHLLGPRIEWGAVGRRAAAGKPARESRWVTVSRAVMRRPVAFLLISLVAMGALAVPSLRLETFTPDARVVPTGAAVREGYDTAKEQFGEGSAAPIQVVVESDAPLWRRSAADSARLLRLHDDLAGLPGAVRVDSVVDPLRRVDATRPFAVLAPRAAAALPADLRGAVRHFVSADGRTLVVEVVGDDTASSPSVRDLLESVRTASAPLAAADGWRVYAGGETAEGVDANEVISDSMLPVVGTMLAVIYLLLLLTFRSVFLPLSAILMNLVSMAATYGVLVLVFQDGWGSGLLGFERSDNLTNFVPVLLVTLLFSLSTDYEVFLLSRVREDYLATGDETDSVARGMAATAPLISGAAVLMVAVFTAFAFAGILPIQQIGIGMAVAIALDATVIRLLVVPASMRLMNRWNWWMPGRKPPVAARR